MEREVKSREMLKQKLRESQKEKALKRVNHPGAEVSFYDYMSCPRNLKKKSVKNNNLMREVGAEKGKT